MWGSPWIPHYIQDCKCLPAPPGVSPNLQNLLMSMGVTSILWSSAQDTHWTITWPGHNQVHLIWEHKITRTLWETRKCYHIDMRLWVPRSFQETTGCIAPQCALWADIDTWLYQGLQRMITVQWGILWSLWTIANFNSASYNLEEGAGAHNYCCITKIHWGQSGYTQDHHQVFVPFYTWQGPSRRCIHITKWHWEPQADA